MTDWRAYIEFRIGDYEHELGLLDTRFAPHGGPDETGGAMIYWAVEDVQASFDRLLTWAPRCTRSPSSGDPGSSRHRWVDPFGNVLGVMYSWLHSALGMGFDEPDLGFVIYWAGLRLRRVPAQSSRAARGWDMPEHDGYEYSGLHAVIFLGGSSAAKIADLVGRLHEREADDDRFRFATEVVGGVHRGYVHVALADENDIAGLQELLPDLSRDEDLAIEVAILGPPYVDPSGEIWAAKPRHCEVLAFVRIWVERGQAEAVLNALQGAVGDVFDGASIVYGAFDILLVLDGPDLASVAGPALAGVPTVSGVVRTETSFADVRRYGGYAEEE